MKLGCVIMAAGASLRFGSNKLLQTLGGIPLYRRALEAVPESVFSAVCVVTACKPMAEEAKTKGFEVVCNDRPELGISRSIHLGLKTMLSCDGVLFMTADQPLLTKNSVRTVAQTFLTEPDFIVAAAANGQRGNPCLFPKAFFPALLALEGDRGGKCIIKDNPHLLRTVQLPAHELTDTDTAQDLARLEACFSAELPV